MNELKKYLEFLELIGFDEVRLRLQEEQVVAVGNASPVEELESLKEEVLNCCRCRLCEKRTNVVFGEGDPCTNLMFVGEAPGEQEDLQGRPFVGRAGQLLTNF